MTTNLKVSTPISLKDVKDDITKVIVKDHAKIADMFAEQFERAYVPT